MATMTRKKKTRSRFIKLFPAFLSIGTLSCFVFYILFYKKGNLNVLKLFSPLSFLQEININGIVHRLPKETSFISHYQFTTISYPSKLTNPTTASYPTFSTLLDITTSWNPNNPELPTIFNETLQHFNYSDHLEAQIAARFKGADVPFKLYNIPDIDRVSELWDDSYLISQINLNLHDNYLEKSKNNVCQILSYDL